MSADSVGIRRFTVEIIKSISIVCSWHPGVIQSQTLDWVIHIEHGLSYNLILEFVLRITEMKCVGDDCKMLVTVLAILVTNIHYLFRLASGINLQKMPPTSLSSNINTTFEKQYFRQSMHHQWKQLVHLLFVNVPYRREEILTTSIIMSKAL